jgi:tetratricopeptide (TPR) repeat protein
MNNRKLQAVLVALLFFVIGVGLPLIAQKSPAAPIESLQAAIQRSPFDYKLRLALGLAYLDLNDFPHALEAFQDAVRLGPNSPEAHNWLGVALMEKSDLPNAVAEFRKAVSLDPKNARAYTNLGSSLAHSSENDEAIAAFKKALVLKPNSPAVELDLGLAFRQKGDLNSALVHLRRVVKSEPKNAMFQYELGQTLRQAGDLAGAVAAFERAVEINPEQQEAYYALGQALKQQSAAMQKLTSPNPSRADEFYKRAQELAAKGDLNAAKEQLTSALQADEKHAQAHNLLGYILGQQGDLTFALNHLQRAVQLRPDYADAHYNFGVALWYSGSRSTAVSELRRSVHLDPAAGAAYAFLGMALRETGDLSAARTDLQCAIALFPSTAASYIDLGIAYLRLGELDRALGQFEAGLNAASFVPAPDWDGAIAGFRAAVLKNDRADAHDMLGLLLGRKGADSADVLAEFREAIRLRPDFAAAHNNMGLVLAQSDDDEKAIPQFREAIRINPNYADAHANLGATLMPTDVEEAILELEKAVSLSPTLVKAQFNLAEAYANSPSHGPARQIEVLRKVVSLSPTFARGHMALGKALLQGGVLSEAVTELQEATRLDPQSGEAHYQLGLALARSGKQQEGTAEVQKGRELSAADERNQNANLDIAEGRAALAKGELEQAAAKLRHAIQLEPASAEAEHFLGVVLQKQGDNEGAVAAYGKALDLNPGDAQAKHALESSELPDSPAPVAKAAASGSEDDQAKVADFESYIREGRFKEVEPLLTDYVSQHPRSEWGWYALGYSQFAQKKIGESIRSLAKALQLDVRNAEAHKILGRDLMIVGRFDAAQTEFEQGIRNDPKSAEIHYDLGKLFSIQDNWESARKQFEEALRIDPSHIQSLDALGLAQEALGDDSGAVDSYQKAIALNEERHGNFVAPDVNLSAYYNRTGDSAKALELAHKALDIDPKADKAWFQKARAEEHQEQLQNAAESLNQAILLNPRSSSYYYVLAGIYRRMGKADESRKALDSFTRLDQENNELEKMRRSMSKPNGAPPPGGQRE